MDQNLTLQLRGEIVEKTSEIILLQNKIYKLEKTIIELNKVIQENDFKTVLPLTEKPTSKLLENPCCICKKRSFRQCEGNPIKKEKCDKWYCYQCIKPVYWKYGDHYWCDDCNMFKENHGVV